MVAAAAAPARFRQRELGTESLRHVLLRGGLRALPLLRGERSVARDGRVAA